MCGCSTNKKKLGVNAGIPVGDFGKFTTFTAGVDLAYLYPLTENFRLGVATGYSHYFGKKNKNRSNSCNS